MTDLDKLIEAVERGDNFGIIPMTQDALTPHEYSNPHGDRVSRAFDGSLDAAKALHEALLDSGFHAELWASCTRPRAMVRRVDEEYVSWSDNTARAWLVCILKAYRSMKEGEAV